MLDAGDVITLTWEDIERRFAERRASHAERRSHTDPD